MNETFLLFQPRTWQRPWGVALVALIVLYGIRVIAFALVLEPINDEGLWLWNARCDLLGFPDSGLLHQALSPVAYWLWSLVFYLAHPSLCLARVVTGLFSILVAIQVVRFLVSKSGLPTAAVGMMWLLIDPYAFRASSWAMLEPMMLLCIVAIHHLETKDADTSRNDALLGLLLACVFAVKITAFWIIAAVFVDRIMRGRWRSLLLMGAVAFVMVVVLYGSIWLTVNQERFVEMWQIHMHSRGARGVVTGLWMLLRDPGGIYYLLTIGSWIVLRVIAWPKDRRISSMDTGLMLGVVYYLTQSYLPQRYVWPLALIAMMEMLPRLMRGNGCLMARKWLPTAVLAVVMLLQSALNWIFIISASNAGGWAAIEEMDKAQQQGFDVASQPCLSIGAQYPIYATSTNLANMPHPDSFHGVMVWNPVAPNPTPTQAWVETLPLMAGHKDYQLGRYWVLWRSSKPQTSNKGRSAGL